jgi:hypothetical protein
LCFPVKPVHGSGNLNTRSIGKRDDGEIGAWRNSFASRPDDPSANGDASLEALVPQSKMQEGSTCREVL